MKQMPKYILSVLLATVLFLCTGCSLDVEQYLRPPKIYGAQQAVQRALETYIHDSGQDGNRYTLCYPVEGEYTAAFILCDAAGRPIEKTSDEAALAVVFYALNTASSDVHINLLRRNDNEWVSVADTVGGSSTILQVAFGDLDGDGTAELVTGWDTYNSRDRRLDVFSLSNGLAAVSGNRVYNRLFVGDMTADGRDSLVLLRVEDESVYATLTHVANGTLRNDGQVWLDSGIQQFTGMTLCRLTDGVYGLYLDAVKNSDTAITELLYVDDDGLHAPFCHQVSRLNTATARPVGFAMRDVDGDMRVDIPQCRLLDGYTAGERTPDYAYRTDWMAWNKQTGDWSVVMSTVLNQSDGYFITLDEVLQDTMTTTYASDTRLLTVMDTTSRQPLLRLRSCIEDRVDEYTLLFAASESHAGCEVWYDSARLDMDTVRYMVARWEG